jgi:hypothetical protein
MAFKLRDGCSIAHLRDMSVILDLKSENYIQIDRSTASSLNLALVAAPSAIKSADLNLLSDLIDNGIIVETSEVLIPPVIYERAKRELPGPPIDAQVSSKGDALAVWTSIAQAKFLLSFSGLNFAIRKLQKIKLHRIAYENTNIDDLSILVERYRRYRPYIYSSHDRCTLNSFSLILYLSRYHYFPKWYFGVSQNPFRAHCWVEDHRFVYDDHFSRIVNFTPILSV